MMVEAAGKTLSRTLRTIGPSGQWRRALPIRIVFTHPTVYRSAPHPVCTGLHQLAGIRWIAAKYLIFACGNLGESGAGTLLMRTLRRLGFHLTLLVR
jgi:hypothetical protein